MKLSHAIGLIGGSLVSLPSLAWAQDVAASTAAGDGTEIVVEARRRDESAQDVPLVVNAVTADSLSKLNIRDFKDITNVVPGLSLVPAANGIGSSSSLRGVNHDVNISGDNGTIQYYLDDAPVGSDTVFQTMFDLGQIEVLRGPQGTLRGKATPSGSITLTTHKPNLSEPGGYVDATAGSRSLKNFNFAIGTPIIRDVLAVRVAGLYDHNGGDGVTSVNSTVKPFNETMALRASALFQPVDWFKAGFSFTTVDRKGANYDQAQSFSLTDPTAGFTPGAPNYGTISLSDRKSVEFSPRTVSVKFQRYAWNTEVDFAGQSLIYVGSYQHTQFNPFAPNDKSGYFPALAVDNMQESRTDSAGWTHEVRLQNRERVMGMFDYVVGYYRSTGGGTGTSVLTNSVVNFANFITLLSPSTTLLPTAPGSGEESYFANLMVHIGDKTELSGGFRHITNTDPGFQGTILASGLTLLGHPPLANNLDATIYSFTLRHRFSDDLMVYASTGSSARPGARDFAFDVTPSLASSPNLLAHDLTKTETSKSYEIGFKSTWWDKKVLLNVSYYHQDFKNYAFQSPSPGIYFLDKDTSGVDKVSSSRFVNNVPVKVDGVEAQIGFKPSSHFSLNATVDWSKSKTGPAELACNVASAGPVPTIAELQAGLPAGERLRVCNTPGGGTVNFQAPWNGSVNAEFSNPIRDKIEGFVRGLVTWHGATANDPDNPYDNVGAYALINAYVGLRDPGGAWSLTFYAKNLTNVVRLTTLDASPFAISVIGAGGAASTTNISRYGAVTVTPPREFGANLRFAFGSR